MAEQLLAVQQSGCLLCQGLPLARPGSYQLARPWQGRLTLARWQPGERSNPIGVLARARSATTISVEGGVGMERESAGLETGRPKRANASLGGAQARLEYARAL